MIIGGLQKTSLIDYPDKISAIIFTQGCNFRCGYCHNPELIRQNDSIIEESSVFNFLNKRKGILDAVVITGGEPTLHKDLTGFISKIKELGYLVKLDSNGTNPEVIKELTDKNLIDYIAMDIKAPIHKYSEITCAKTDASAIKKSIDIITSSKIGYEFRTTVVKSQLSFKDFEEIGKMIENANLYYLQEFTPTKTLEPKFLNESTYSKEEFNEIIKILNKYVKDVYVR